ncbi:MAG: hypothetical protein GX358_04765 [candidate division WS1 bacterium]|mgnify:CR=1 FL=1|jgi:hypothetical protein|nr:hypothetical protein [candidate division WS1 bacterium]
MYRYTMMIPLTVLAVLGVGLFVVGCGGGGDDSPGGAPTGSLQFSVHFPPSPQEVQPAVIYPETNSITVDILDSVTREQIVPPTTLNRSGPGGGPVRTTISAIPIGTWLVRVTGWSELDSAGRLLSRVYDMVTIVIAQTTTKNVVMEGYPVSLAITAASHPVLVDLTTELVTTPMAINGDVVLGTFAYEWSSGDETITVLDAASTTDTAIFRGVSRGSTDITCKLVHDDPVPGQPEVAREFDLRVNPNVDDVVVTPDTLILLSGKSATATATASYKTVAVVPVEFSFASSDTSVATVTRLGDDQCRIDAIKAGVASITVSQPYTGASATIDIAVPEGSLDVSITRIGAQQ